MTICNNLRRFLCQFPKKNHDFDDLDKAVMISDGYSEFDGFKRSGAMYRCPGMPGT